MSFSADLSADDIAWKEQPIDTIKDAVHILRKEIESCTFGLKKKHCDTFDLKDAWTNGRIKENSETFLAALCNLSTIAIDADSLKEK